MRSVTSIKTHDLILNYILNNSGMSASISRVRNELRLTNNYATVCDHIIRLLQKNKIVEFNGRYYDPNDPVLIDKLEGLEVALQ